MIESVFLSSAQPVKTEALIQTIKQIHNLPINEDKFKEICFELYEFQKDNNRIYAQWLNLLYEVDKPLKNLADIPFLPISCFKNGLVSCYDQHEIEFTSSSTTGLGVSRHYIHKTEDYKNTFLAGFKAFSSAQPYDFIAALLPSYLDRNGSGLIYMVQHLMEEPGVSGKFYNLDVDSLLQDLTSPENKNKKILLFGVTFALIQFAKFTGKLNLNIDVIETGGMKGKGPEWVREELHTYLCKQWGIQNIYSEYGMTELTSQAYSHGQGRFICPPWMKILIQDPSDYTAFLSYGKTGRICVIDLMNYHSCAFIATDDLGRLNKDGSFEIMGRIDYSDLRGCNLLV